MLEQKDIQTLTAAISEQIRASEARIMDGVNVLMETTFTRRFDLLAEGQQAILDKLVPTSRVEDLEEEVRFLKSIVRQMQEDIQALKRAQ